MPERAAAHTALSPGPEKLWDAAAGFISSIALEKGLAVNTQQAYRRDLADFIDFTTRSGIGDWASVTPRQITQYVSELIEVGAAEATVGRRLSALRGLFAFLTREKYISSDPSEIVIGPRLKRKLPEVLSVEDIKLLISAVDISSPAGLRDWAMLELVYGCGLRVSELVNVKSADFLFGGEILRVLGKGSKERLVPVGGCARAALVEYLQKGRPALMRDPKAARDRLFLSVKLGKPLTRVGFWALLKEIALRAGLSRRVTPHIFRHSFATHLLEGGAGLRDVQELLGHVSIDTTMIYTHIDRTHLIEVVRTFHPRN